MLAGLPLLLQHPHEPIERRRRQQRVVGVVGEIHVSERVNAERWGSESSDLSENTSPDGAIFIPTSGSSGQPKVVPITAYQLIESARRVNERLSVSEKSVWLLSLMPAHIGGLSIIVRAVVAGCTLVIPDDLKRTTLSRIARAQQVSHLSLVPSIAEQFISSGPLPPSLEALLLGGERMTLTQRKKLTTVRACYFSYGATETASCVAVSRLADLEGLPDAVGTPIADTVVKIIGDEEEVLPVGEIGIVEISGPTVVVQNPTTRCAPHPTWRSTDRGFLDPNGILHLIGRADDIINSGGIKVSAHEIIDAALTTGLVEEAAVIKTPDIRWGERAVLFATARESINACELTSAAILLEMLRDHLGRTRIPREIIVLTALPRTSIGKVDRAALSNYALNADRENSPLHLFVREHLDVAAQRPP